MAGTSRGRIRKWNPGTFQSDAQVVEQFVVRRHELRVVLEVLRENIGSPSCQHVLVVAPRGWGKTMLLARVAAELRIDRPLSGELLPVRFMEESHEVYGIADFWLEALFHLAGECSSRCPELARELLETHASLCGRWPEQGFEERARAAVLGAADRLGKRLVLMVENLQSLCDDVDPDFGWKLREVLQFRPEVMLLATATSRFSALENADEPFFELFRTVDLSPLDTGECRRLWQAVSGDEAREREIRPLQILTGGSPRFVVIVAGFVRHRSRNRLMEELVSLIDEHTEYFRGNLNSMPKTERRVYIAVIDLWRPSKTGEIAVRARVDVRVASTMLGRLVTQGAVVFEGSGKKRLYRAAEGLYSIYYKVRRRHDEAAVVQGLLRLMTVLYSESEREKLWSGSRREAADSAAMRSGPDRWAGKDLDPDDMSPLLERPMADSKEQERRLVLEIHEAFTNGAYGRVVGIVDEAMNSPGTVSLPYRPETIGWALLEKADASERLDDFVAAADTYDDVVQRFGDSESADLEWRVAVALVKKADALGKLGRFEASASTCDELIRRFAASEVPLIQEQIASALLRRASVQRELGNFVAAIASCDEMVKRFGADASTFDGAICAALDRKGLLQREAGDFRGAIATWDELVQRIEGSALSSAGWRIVSALDDKASAYEELGDPEAATAAYDEIVARFSAADDWDSLRTVSRALIHKGHMLVGRGDRQAGMAAFDEVVERFGGSEQPALQQQVASALRNKMFVQAEVGELDAAMRTCDEVVERFGRSASEDLLREVAFALDGKGYALRERGDLVSAEAAYDDLIARFGGSESPEFRRMAAEAWIDKGRMRRRLEDFEKGVAVYRELIAVWGDSGWRDLPRQFASALVDMSTVQLERGRTEDALKICEDVEGRLDSVTADDRVLLAWRMHGVRARARVAQGPSEAVLRAFVAAFGFFVADDITMLREMVDLVTELVVAGASPQGLERAMADDEAKSEALSPLIAALRLEAGDEVRVPVEVREVADDIRKEIRERRETRAASTLPSVDAAGPSSAAHGAPA